MRLARVVGVVALVVAAASAGSAEAQAGYNEGGSTAPDGMWFGFGLNAGAGAPPAGGGLRVELGVPLTLAGPGQLSINFPLSTWHGKVGGCFAGECNRFRWNALYFVPEVQWEYVFPIRMRHRFSLVALAGVGFAMYWQYYDDVPGFGTQRDADFGFVPFRTGVAARFGFVNGWFLQVMPFGFGLNVRFGDDFDDDVFFGNEDRFFVTYEFWAMAGYRWE